MHHERQVEGTEAQGPASNQLGVALGDGESIAFSGGALMAELVVDTEGVLAYGAATAAMAERIAAAGAAAAACGPAVLAPVFGLIGQEFLGAVIGTHRAHTDAVGRLAGAVASLGCAATASAVSYALTDAGTDASVAASATGIASPGRPLP